MNFLPGELFADPVRLPIGTLALDDELRGAVRAAPGPAGREIIVGMRPGHFEDAALVSPEQHGSATCTAKIDVLESLGSEYSRTTAIARTSGWRAWAGSSGSRTTGSSSASRRFSTTATCCPRSTTSSRRSRTPAAMWVGSCAGAGWPPERRDRVYLGVTSFCSACPMSRSPGTRQSTRSVVFMSTSDRGFHTAIVPPDAGPRASDEHRPIAVWSCRALVTAGCCRRLTGSLDSVAPDQTRLVETLGERLGPAVSCVTTEHFNLQTARASTVSEANGRASIYLAAVSSSLIALGFIGQTARLGSAFRAFALILLPVLAFVGVVTFQRLVQSSIEDMAYARRIARLRAFYLALVPELAPYVLSVCGVESLRRPNGWQLSLTTAGMVAVVNSVVLGAFAGVLLKTLGDPPLGLTLAPGAVVGAAGLSLRAGHHRHARDRFSVENVDRSAILVAEGQSPA
jgi:hypothetical protein